MHITLAHIRSRVSSDFHEGPGVHAACSDTSQKSVPQCVKNKRADAARPQGVLVLFPNGRWLCVTAAGLGTPDPSFLWTPLGFEYGFQNRLDPRRDRKSTRLNSSHSSISYAV